MEDARVPGRIASAMPQMRLVALLRNPIDRALSQYRQQVRRGKERRTFEQAVAAQANPAALRRARTGDPKRPASETYLATGEYGRILQGYLAFFPSESLRVVFSEDLAAAPRRVVREVFGFLGVDPDHVPENLGTRYHQGGGRERFPNLVARLKQMGPARSVWRLLPRHRRRAIWTWFFTQANVVREQPPEIAPELRARLVELFRSDVGVVAEIAGRKPPWPEFGAVTAVTPEP